MKTILLRAVKQYRDLQVAKFCDIASPEQLAELTQIADYIHFISKEIGLDDWANAVIVQSDLTNPEDVVSF